MASYVLPAPVGWLPATRVAFRNGRKAKRGAALGSEEKEDEADEKQRSVSSLIGYFGGGGKGKRAVKMTPSNGDSLGMTAVLPDVSHLGSRIDTELWGQHVAGHATLPQPQPQQRGLQLRLAVDNSQLTAAAPFDPYATANLVQYEAMQAQPMSLSVTQMLASSLTDSQLLAAAPVIEQPTFSRRMPRVLTPTVSFDEAVRAFKKAEQDSEAVAAAHSNFSLLHAAYAAQSGQRSLTPTHLTSAGHLVGAYSSAGLLASPRLNPMPAAAATVPPIAATNATADEKKAKWRVEEKAGELLQQPSLSHRRARTAVNVATESLQLEDVDNTPPAGKATTAAQSRSASVQRASTFASAMPRGRLIRPRSKSIAGTDGDGIEVPINPMIPVNCDTPRYRAEVYNTRTGRRQFSVSRGSSAVLSRHDSASSSRTDEEVIDNVNRQHPLFENNHMRAKQQPSVHEEEEL